jgi:hypothetical protein
METFIDDGYRRIRKSEDRKEVLRTNKAGRLKERPKMKGQPSLELGDLKYPGDSEKTTEERSRKPKKEEYLGGNQRSSEIGSDGKHYPQIRKY